MQQTNVLVAVNKAYYTRRSNDMRNSKSVGAGILLDRDLQLTHWYILIFYYCYCNRSSPASVLLLECTRRKESEPWPPWEETTQIVPRFARNRSSPRHTPPAKGNGWTGEETGWMEAVSIPKIEPSGPERDNERWLTKQRSTDLVVTSDSPQTGQGSSDDRSERRFKREHRGKVRSEQRAGFCGKTSSHVHIRMYTTLVLPPASVLSRLVQARLHE